MRYIAPKKREAGSDFYQPEIPFEQDTDTLHRFIRKNGWSANYILRVATRLQSRMLDSPEALFDID